MWSSTLIQATPTAQPQIQHWAHHQNRELKGNGSASLHFPLLQEAETATRVKHSEARAFASSDCIHNLNTALL